MKIFGFGKNNEEKGNKSDTNKNNGSENISTDTSAFSIAKEALKMTMGQTMRLEVDGASYVVKKAIQGSGMVIRKIYEARINVVNDFSNVKPDWEFIDSDTVKNKIAALEKILERETASYEKHKRNSVKEKIQCTLSDLTIKYSLLGKNGLQKSHDIAEKHHLETPFVKYGLPCLDAYECGEYDKAKKKAAHCYEVAGGIVENPIIDYCAALQLMEELQYEKARECLNYAVKCCPEKKEIHEALLALHQATKNEKGAEIEKSIISLL